MVNNSLHLIPPFLGEEVKSSAERKVFEILKELNIPNSYVFHSLGLPRHNTKNYGETDFVLVCPRGIACFEVKGGRLAFENGKWIYINRYGEENAKSESPFEQAKGNMYSLMTALNNPEYSLNFSRNILFAFGVVFPDIDFSIRGEEIINEVVYDLKTCDITKYVNSVFDYWQSRPNNARCKNLEPQQIEKIVNTLRPSFNFVPSLSTRLDETESRLVNLTREQSLVLDSLSANSHLMISGGAGTGKTLLASHYAQTLAGQGKKVLYLSFNKNLANTVSRHAKAENLKIINIHAFFGEYVETSPEEIKKNPQEYFGEKLPSLFCDYFNSLDEDEKECLRFDALVMDEAQDFIRTENLLALDLILKGGLERGRWAAFYDAEQNIYNENFSEGFELLDSYNSAKFSLSVNCRNTVQIGKYCEKESGIKSNSFLRENGEAVRHVQYTDDNDFGKCARKILSELQAEKISPKEVTFLSSKSYLKSILSRAGLKVNDLANNYNASSSLLPRFSTIQGFKGLDSRIVVLCERELIRPENYSKYVYVATTRARVLLYVMSKNS